LAEAAVLAGRRGGGVVFVIFLVGMPPCVWGLLGGNHHFAIASAYLNKGGIKRAQPDRKMNKRVESEG
jgi:hypothetical protein